MKIINELTVIITINQIEIVINYIIPNFCYVYGSAFQPSIKGLYPDFLFRSVFVCSA